MKKIRISLIFSAFALLLSSISFVREKEPIKTFAESTSHEIVSLYSDDFTSSGEYKNIVATISNTDYTVACQLTDISLKTNASQKIKFYDSSYNLLDSIENNVTFIWDENAVLFQFHSSDLSSVKIVTFEEGLYLPSQQLATTGAGENYVLDKSYTFINKDYNRNNWFQCTEIGEETYTSIRQVDVWENKSGDVLLSYNVCFHLNDYDHSPNDFNTNAYDYLTNIGDNLSYYDENGDEMNGISYNQELYVCSFGNHILIQVVTSNPIHQFRLSNKARFPSYQMCTTGRGSYYRIKFDIFVTKNESGQYILSQPNDANIETSIISINTLTNDSITVLFNETDYQYIDSSSIVGTRRNEYDYLDKTYITSNNKIYLLRDILKNSHDFYFNYLGHMNSYTFSVIIDTNTISRITFKDDTSFPKYSYTGASVSEEVSSGGSNVKTSIIISEVSYVKYGNDFVKNQINGLTYVREIRLGDFGDSNRFWFYLDGTDYPTSDNGDVNANANIDVNSKCLQLNTYDKIKVDGKTLNQYRAEGKLAEGGFINRFTRWCAFSFSISGITNSSEDKAYYADKVEILKGCQFPAFSNNSYYLFDGYLKTTVNTNDTFFASCSMGPVSLKAGDPNGDITERFFVKLSESDYTKTSEITGDYASWVKSSFTLDSTSFATDGLVQKLYKNCMGRTDTIGFVFSPSYIYDLKDQNHTISVAAGTILPTEVDSSTPYVSYYYGINRAYKFANWLTISNGQWFDASEVELFCENYLYMSTYNTSLGYCNDNEHHYYKTAKEIYDQFDIYQKKYFQSACYDAFVRFQTWANMNGETINPVANQAKKNLNTNDNIRFAIVILPIAIISLTGIFLYFYLRKIRRHKEK